MLRHLGHTRGATSMEIRRHTVASTVSEIERGILLFQLGGEVQHIGMMPAGVLGPHQGNDP